MGVLHPLIACLTLAIVLGGGGVTPSLALTDRADALVIAKIQEAWLPKNFSRFWDAGDPCASKIVNDQQFVWSESDPNVYNYFLLCDKAGRVRAIDLTNQHLLGELVPEIGNLQHLVSLKLSNNNFTGTIPTSWTTIPFLEKLELGGNQLSGVVSPLMGNLQFLTELSLSDQQPPGVFGGTIPSELGKLSRVRFLALSGLNLTGTIPPSLGNCSNLEYLFLYQNLLHGELPASFSRLQLKAGSFDDNYLQGYIPAHLANLTDLASTPSGAFQGNCFERNATNFDYVQYQKNTIDCIEFYDRLPPPTPPPASPLPLAPAPLVPAAPAPTNANRSVPPGITGGSNASVPAGGPRGAPTGTAGAVPPVGSGNGGAAANSSSSETKQTSKGSGIGIIIGIMMGALCLIVAIATIIAVFCCRRKRSLRGHMGVTMSVVGGDGYVTMGGGLDKTPRSAPPQASPLWIVSSNSKLPYGPTIFPYNELKQATDDFSSERVLGKGGFGAVYHGILPSDGSAVAIKVLSANSSQGEKEFFAELSLISQLSHRNLVRLRGWCNDDDVPAVLVYEFFPGGSLEKHLFPKDDSKPVVSWTQRYRIITGVAQALNYMHEEWTEQVVHRDVKSSNILLDSHMNGYLGDFGLALSAGHDVTHFPSTRPAFTFGYAPPEAFCTNRATPKWDVFSFGVVCLEVASGQKAFDPKRMTEEDSNAASLWYYAWKMYNTGQLLELADQRLQGQYPHDEMVKLLSLGLLCISRKPEDRPHMRDAVRILQSPPSTPVPLPMMDPSLDPTLPDNFDARSFLSSSTGNSSVRTPSYGQPSPSHPSTNSDLSASVVQNSLFLSGR